jgi:hypothetical protein
MKDSAYAFLSACEDLSPTQACKSGICGEWSAKAVVDHLTGWQVQSLPILQQLLSGAAEAFDLDIDAFNRTSVSSREDLSWEESLEALRFSFSAFDQAVDEIPTAQYRTNPGFKSWLKAMTHEYRFHLPHIKNAQKM